ncbi:MAG: hypothetical protein AABW80_02265 [Nanoarchaeota archaeon]
MDEAERDKIREEAQEILKKFSESLKSVKLKKKKKLKNQVSGFREEMNGTECDKDFRERMFANAPNKEGDKIIAEKKQW